MMTSLQRTLIGVLLIIFLFIITLVRSEIFVKHWIGIWLFKVLVLSQFLVPIVLFARNKRRLRWGLLVVLLTGELAIWGYGSYLANKQNHYVRGRRLMQEVMDGWDKNLIQFDPTLSQHDSALFYTLKPQIANIPFRSGLEINTSIRTNSLGLRDDEASLENPAIVLLGDSFTMGWGVSDSACFASVLEKKLGQKSLNAGISSFGTARESQLFKRIKRDSIRVLIIQYCLNDQDENEQMVAGTFVPSAEEKYKEAVRYNALTADYYPCKYLYAVLKLAAQKLLVWQAKRSSETVKSVATNLPKRSYEEAFFAVLQRIRADYAGPIVITCLNPEVTTSATIRDFRAFLNRNPMPGIYLADVGDVLTPDDYFTLDNHINASGHRKVAERLADVIQSNRLLD